MAPILRPIWSPPHASEPRPKASISSIASLMLKNCPSQTQSSTPFKWNGGKQTAVIGLNSVKLNKDTIIASYTLFADGVYCDFDPIKRKAGIGSNFLERELF